MKSFDIRLLLGLALWPGVAGAQLQLLSDNAVPCVFAGQGRKIVLTWQNAGDQIFEEEVRTRIYEASSSTAAPYAEKAWKELRVLPRQTVLESVLLDFPAVRAETKFVVQWLENSNHVLGRTEVLVYPTNLLQELKELADANGDFLGVLDPHNQLMPTLKSSAVKFLDLSETELDAFHGKLALVGPCDPEDPEWRGLPDRIARLARRGTPVVWVQSPPPQRNKIWPSFYAVPEKTHAVVMVHPDLVADLPENPRSQLNLIYFCRLALDPQPLTLPELSSNP